MGKGVKPGECRFLETKRFQGYNIYNVYFNSIGEVEGFLKSEPEVNTEVFTSQMSLIAREDFAGPPLDRAIAYCVGGYDAEYGAFLKLSHQLESVNSQTFTDRKLESSFVGHRPNVPAFIAGEPKNMYRTVRAVEKKVINVFMQVTYDRNTSENQILHRGILTLNLIRLLELNNYIVNFKVFEVSSVRNEVFVCEVALKRPGEKIDPRKCYYPMCGKAFVRRVLMRIKESIPFRENWHMSYGMVTLESFTKRILGVGEKDIYIGTPKEMGIQGIDLYADADSFLEKAGLEGKVVVPKYYKI